MVPPALARRLLVGVILLTTLGACTGSDDSAAEVAAATVTPTTAARATPVPPTPEPTTAPTATAEPAPTPTLEPTPEPTLDPVARAEADIELIKTVHTRFMTELLARDERDEASVETFLTLAEELTAGEQLQFLREALAERQAEMRYFVGNGIVSNIGDINIYEDGLVEVFDCSRATGTIVDADGVGEEGQTNFEWRASYLRLQTDNAWRVEHFDSRLDEACEPT